VKFILEDMVLVIYSKVEEDAVLNIEHYTSKNFKNFFRPLNLTKDVLIRVAFIEKEYMLLCLDHSIGDGYSFGVIIDELEKLYNNKKLKELPIQFSDYAIHFENNIKDKKCIEQFEYYHSIYDGYCEMINLPIRKPISGDKESLKKYNEFKNIEEYRKKFDEDFQKFSDIKIAQRHYRPIFYAIDPDSSKIINNITKKYRLSKTTFFITIYSLAISLYSAQNNIFLSTISTNRANPYYQNLIGVFVRFVPLVIKIEDVENNTLLNLIRKTTDVLLKTFSFDIPLSVVCDELKILPSNFLYIYNSYHMKNGDDDMDLIEITSVEEVFKRYNMKEFDTDNNSDCICLPYQQGYTDLQLLVNEEKDHYKIINFYYDDMYDYSVIKGIFDIFIHILKNESYLHKKLKDITKSSVFEDISVENCTHDDITENNISQENNNNNQCEKETDVENDIENEVKNDFSPENNNNNQCEKETTVENDIVNNIENDIENDIEDDSSPENNNNQCEKETNVENDIDSSPENNNNQCEKETNVENNIDSSPENNNNQCEKETNVENDIDSSPENNNNQCENETDVENDIDYSSPENNNNQCEKETDVENDIENDSSPENNTNDIENNSSPVKNANSKKNNKGVFRKFIDKIKNFFK